MKKRYQSIISKVYPFTFIVLIILLWQLICSFKIVPQFMLPSPIDVIIALIKDFPLLISHAKTSLLESFIGLFFSIVAAFVFAILMDRFLFIFKAAYPVAVITQTVPTIAIAPLLVLWMGYGIMPKIALIFITCFFPILIGLLSGFESVNKSVLRLYKSMGASYFQVLTNVKIPYALDGFYSGLRISASYAIVGAVISEWLGGESGLGVYMTRVRKAYSFDKMFAVIILISIISLLIVKLVDIMHDASMPWKKFEKGE